MSISTRLFRIAVVTFLAALAWSAEVRPAGSVLWLDFDMKNIPEPKERDSGYYDYFFKGQLIEETKKDLDIPRWVRRATGHPRQSSNVNALDEVPDSSWYTNRHHLHPMTIDELVRGPNRGAGPDFSKATITKIKTSGASPGLWLKDATGQAYIVKFDLTTYPGLQSGAEVVSTKILYAAGYFVPENYVGYLDPDALTIDEKAEITDPKTGKKRALSRDDIDEMFKRVAKMPDGRYRGMASKILAGKPKGPFSQIGFRRDDPNDLIPHEDRRELRGLRVIASWINDWDLKEPQSLDMYVEEGGRKFLRHYLLDFGSSLGADTTPTEYYHGREYGLDSKSITKEVLTLGKYQAADEKHGVMISPEVGMFTAKDFDPEHWKQTYPAIMFDNMTDQDAFWATRIILSFTEPELRSIVQTGEYTDPRDAEYIVQTLLERRRMVARSWLSKVDALANFAVRPVTEGMALTFRDLMIDNDLAQPATTSYTFQIKGRHYKSEKRVVQRQEILLDRAALGAARERDGGGAPIQLTIWTNRGGAPSLPVNIYLDWPSPAETASIVRISRG
jgi:hypothetical protein